jgi:NitT/TauT family transport system substrate-binding protein
LISAQIKKFGLGLVFLLGLPVGAAPLSIGTSLWVGYSPFYIAKAKGYFKAQGLELQERFFTVGSDGPVALGAGKIDGLLAVVSDMITLSAKGKKVQNLIIADYSNGADGIVARGVSDVKGLKGKKVSVEFGTPWQYLLLRALDLNGLTEQDLKLTNASGDAGTAAFVGGQLDALAIGEPALSLAAQRGKGKIIFDSRALPGELIDSVSFSAEVVAKRPADVKKFMTAWFQGVDFLYKNPQEAQSIVAKTLGIPPAQVQALLKNDTVLTLSQNKEAFFNPKSPLAVVKNAQLNATFLVKRGVIRQAPDLKAMHDNPLLKSL